MSVTLMGFDIPLNMRLWKIAAALRVAGISYSFTPLEFNVDNLKKEYMDNCSPMGRSPVLQTEKGYIFESNAILRHVARTDKNNSYLYGRTTFEQAQVDSWLDYATTELDKPAAFFLMKNAFGVPVTAEEETKMAAEAYEALAGLERWLDVRTFVAGQRLTIADIGLAFNIDWLFRFAGGELQEEFTKKYKNVVRFYHTIMYQPKVVEAVQAHGGPIGLPNPEKPKKDERPEAAATRDKKKSTEGELKEEKKPNPLDLLSPSKFVLNTFKREYANKDTRKEAAPYLFRNFDSEGFTAFWCKYQFNDELTKAFMTSNLVRGWFQRMDHLRKYAFGSVVISGSEEKHQVTGFWIFRGKGMPQVIKDTDDFDLYTWTEIPDINAEADRITDYLAWDGKTFDDSNSCLDGKVYK